MDDQQVMTSRRQHKRAFEREADRYTAMEIHPDVAFRVALYTVREREGVGKFQAIRSHKEFLMAEKELKQNPPKQQRRGLT